MQIYLVGGAVRNQLLDLPVTERDWVVVGATPEEMIIRGFKPVGRHFPVFLHPDTSEEYALARTERKTAPGYHGFEFHTGAGVGLEEDLRRRDLTINAIARDRKGNLIDPWRGKSDIDNRLLRHVSPAFMEDPVRILRVARFAARFASLGFRVAPETLALMREMTSRGETQALVAERVWRECETALSELSPSRFFVTLRDTGTLACAVRGQMPEVARLLESPETVEEITGTIDRCAAESSIEQRPSIVLAALVIEVTARNIALDAVPVHLRMPSHYSKLIAGASFCWRRISESARLDARTLFDIFKHTGAFRDARQLKTILAAWKFCRFPLADRERSLVRIHKSLDAVNRLDLRRVSESCSGNIGEAVHAARMEALSQEHDENDHPHDQTVEDKG